MPEIVLKTWIRAPIERCFDLSRSIDLHQISTAHTNEKAIAGKTSGLIALGESVTWSARHFGIRMTLTSRITDFHFPYKFTDEMMSGPFEYFRHDHLFESTADGTLMADRFHYRAPLDFVGRLADYFFLEG